MQTGEFDEWVRRVLDTQEEEISCSECFDETSRYVELELAGDDPAAKLPRVRHHLAQCRACREDYQALRDFIISERGAPGK